MKNETFTYLSSVCFGTVQVVIACGKDKILGMRCQRAVDFETGCYTLVQTKSYWRLVKEFTYLHTCFS